MKGPSKPNKYRNVRTEVDGIMFASKAEARRYQELNLMKRAGLITGPALQCRFEIKVNKMHICDYVADFVYHDKNGNQIVEDVKGVETPVFKLKRQLMWAVHGIHVVTV